MKLLMVDFLAAVRDHGIFAREYLISAGYHPKVIYAKAEKAERRGYYDFGVVADRGWLTEAGAEKLGQFRRIEVDDE